MSSTKCKAKTRSGARCNLNANTSGYCHLHDPEKIKSRAEQKKANLEKGSKMREVLEVVHRTCSAKGWESYTSNLDENNWKYATVSVKRFVSSSFSGDTITGIFEFTLENGVQISRSGTSFYKYGLQDLYDAIFSDLSKLPWIESPKREKNTPEAAIVSLEKLIKRFHVVARILKNRYNDRETIVVEDEYDVQDLLHALLRAIFNDVRPEEYTPSYAGSASRIDFLLKPEKIAVEVKITRKSLRDKQIGEQLIVDIKRYQSHPECENLVCFVYDPANWIKNPTALENDLTGKHGNLNVKVFIVPH
jgi:hypothetical protein